MGRSRWLPLLVSASMGALASGCTPGLDAPLAPAGADASPILDAQSSGPDDAAALDARLDQAPDATPPDDATVLPPDSGADDRDAGSLDVPAPAPDGGTTTEACEARPELASCNATWIASAPNVRLVRLARVRTGRVLVAFATDQELRVYGAAVSGGVIDTPVLLIADRLPFGGQPVDLSLSADDHQWLVLVATDRGLACRHLASDGVLTSSTSVRLDGVRSADVLLWDDDVVVTAARAAGGAPRVMRWDDEDDCPPFGAGGSNGALLTTRAPPRDVLLREEGALPHLAISSSAAVDGGLFIDVLDNRNAAPDWPLLGPVFDARIDVVMEGRGHHAGLVSRSGPGAPGQLVLVDAPDAQQRFSRGTRTIAGELGMDRCGGGCTAAAFTPADSPARVQVEFFDGDLRLRSNDPRYRVGCAASGSVASLDLVESPQNNHVLVGWSDGTEVFASECERP